MSSGILFNQGPSKGNPYALGVNLPVPIVLKEQGVNQAPRNEIKHHGQDNYLNGKKGTYQLSEQCPTLSVYLQNSRYAENKYYKNPINAPMFEDINALNPKIMLFQWSLKKGNVNNKQNGNVIKNGAFRHPSHIVDGSEANTYTNFGQGQFGGYTDNTASFGAVTAYSEWNLTNNPFDWQNKVVLDNMNPFRYYCNNKMKEMQERYFNTRENFFNGDTWGDWVMSKYRTQPHGNNYRMYRDGRPFDFKPSQSDFNIYLAFALVINNPENPNQFIIGPFSKVVRQRLLMGYNSSGNKVPKAFTYIV